MSISNYAEAQILDALFNNDTFAVATPYVSLHTADPGETGASETSGGSYIRKLASFGAASGGAISSDAELEWLDMPDVTITHVGIWDAESAGNFLWGGALVASKDLNAGDTFTIPSGDLDITLD
jgi:hypothetical protein